MEEDEFCFPTLLEDGAVRWVLGADPREVQPTVQRGLRTRVPWRAHGLRAQVGLDMRGLNARAVSPVCGDTLRLPFPDGSFHGAMVAFGIRNLAGLDRGFQEFFRVLRPGGRLVILEFTTPPNLLLRRLYLFYFHRILPLVGRIVSGHPWAYTYLPESVKEFPGPGELARRLQEAGFRRVEWEYVTGGIAAIHVAERG